MLRRLFAGEPVDFHGEHYRITDLDGTPEPVHARRSARSSSAAAVGGCCASPATHADIVGVNPSVHSGEIDTAAAQDALPASIDEKIGWVREAAGERLDDLELNAWLVGRRRSPTTPPASPR